MSVKGTPHCNEKRGVVIVDAEKFLKLWGADPYGVHHEVSHGSPQTWPNDRKYSDAEKGFSFGLANPVPLAVVSGATAVKTSISYKFLFFGRNVRRVNIPYVTFTNGITRTIWLLTQGCKAFPVECRMPEARELYRIAAAPGTNFFTVEELGVP